MAYEDLLAEVYDIIINSEYERAHDIFADMIFYDEKYNFLTLTQHKYILNKVSSVVNYYNHDVYYNFKLFKALNNNQKLKNFEININRICLNMRYMPNNKNKGDLFKHIMFFMRHNKKRFSEKSYDNMLQLIVKSTMLQLNQLSGN